MNDVIEQAKKLVGTVGGPVTAPYLRVVDDLGHIGLEIGIRNQDGQESTPGTAVGVVPLASGPVVPYPFPHHGR